MRLQSTECGHVVYVHVFVMACVGDMSVNSEGIIPGLYLKQHVCKSSRLTRRTLLLQAWQPSSNLSGYCGLFPRLPFTIMSNVICEPAFNSRFYYMEIAMSLRTYKMPVCMLA